MVSAYAKLSTSDGGEFYLGLEGRMVQVDGSSYVRPMQATTPLMSRDDMGEVVTHSGEDALIEEILFRAEGVSVHDDPGTGLWVFIDAGVTLDVMRQNVK